MGLLCWSYLIKWLAVLAEKTEKVCLEVKSPCDLDLVCGDDRRGHFRNGGSKTPSKPELP